MSTHDKDVFVNVVGGLQINEPAADLAVAVALASSIKDRPIHADMAFIGEIGLSGEIRAVSQIGTRLKEAKKLGFSKCVVPQTARKRLQDVPKGLELISCRSLIEAVNAAMLPK